MLTLVQHITYVDMSTTAMLLILILVQQHIAYGNMNATAHYLW